ncbi:hypothetical protein GCM10022403_053270 [Streptomyces coacervatus]|uniref:Peptidase C14 caspase domain-containing protein n=1 Tax=Streptomyces coacervatus TaxID=647381 RepID=A0ABP7I9K9_9ACTN|nr:caspase family protein [Streptomyces coacervatus]MDF2272805.1 caspase family protein [Streptomyces coacervatus]
MGRRFALLIATYEYQDPGLRQLTSPAHDAEALAAVLRDPDIAGFEVTTLLNQPHHVVGEAIGDFYRGRRGDDLTLLYFTGHGLKDEEGRLYLAMANSRPDGLLFSALSDEQISQAMESCRSRQKVLILDCCYSGAFGRRPTKGDTSVQTLERFGGRGRTVLTASDATQYSFEGDRAQGHAAQSVFTRYLVEGLRDGGADLDGDGDITLDELYSYVYDRVVAEMPQQRPKKQADVEGRTVIAGNINWTLPGYLRNAVDSPLAGDRLGGIEGLARLHRIGNERVRAAVLEELGGLADDDSKSVSAGAAEALRSLTAGPEPAVAVAVAVEQPPVPVPERPSEPPPEPAPTSAPRVPRSRRTGIVAPAVTALVVALATVVTVILIDSGKGDGSSSHGSSAVAEGSRPVPGKTLDGAGTQVEFSPDGKTLATGDGKTVRLWQGGMTQPATVLTHQILGEFSPDGKTLATQTDQLKVRLRNIATGKTIGLGSEVDVSTAFSPDSRTIATASMVVTQQPHSVPVRVWDVATGKLRATLNGHTDGIEAMAFTPDGTLITASTDDTVRLWNVTTGKTIRTIGEDKEAYVYYMTASPDGKAIATWDGGDDAPLRLWNTATGKVITTLNGSGGAFSPDSKLFAFTDSTGLQLWDIGTDKSAKSLGGAGSPIRFAPKGNILAANALSSNSTVQLWDTATRKVTASLPGGADALASVAFSEDGQALAAADKKGTVRVWDVARYS